MKSGVKFVGCKLFALAIIGAVALANSNSGAQCEPIEIFDHLNRLLDYFQQNANARTSDAMLGIYLCKGFVLTDFEKPFNFIV